MTTATLDEVAQATGLTSPELVIETVLSLFQQERLTLGQAARLAGMNRLQFQHLLSSRDIPVHYDVADFEADVQNLRELGRL